MPDFKIELWARETPGEPGYALALETDDGGFYGLGHANDRDHALHLIYDALTAPLADVEKLKQVDELSTQLQTTVDEVGNLIEKVSQLEQRVSGVDVLAELAKLAEALASGRSGASIGVASTGGLRRPPVPDPRPQTPAGPDRGLRRELVPHQPRGGAVHRGEAVTEHGEG